MPPNWRYCSHCEVLLPVDAARPAPLRCPSCQGALVVPTEPGDTALATIYAPDAEMLLAASAAPTSWYYAQNKQKLGPVTRAQLRQLATAGRLRSGDMVLQEGQHQWQPASSLPDLFPSGAVPVSVSAAPTVPASGWYYARSRTRAGPLTLVQLRQLVESKQLQASDMVLPEGQTKWRPAGTAPELFPPAAEQVPVAAALAAGWFYAQNKAKIGPLSLEQLRLLAVNGTLHAADMVLPQGSAKWQAAGTFPELFPAKPPAPVVNGSAVAPADATPSGWYYLQGKKKIGPVTLEQMRQLVAFGLLRGPDMVLPEARKQWASVSELAELMVPPPTPPVPPAPPLGWFYAVNKKKFGPLTRSELEQAIADGRLVPSDMVLPEGSTKWTSAGLIEGLFPALTSRPATSAEDGAEEDSVFPLAAPTPLPPETPETAASTELVEPAEDRTTEEAESSLTEVPVEELDLASIVADDTAAPRPLDSSDSLLARLSDFEEPPSVVADDQPRASASVFDSFIGGMLKDQPLPPVAKPRLRPAGNRACPHCHGTAYCGRRWDGAGIMESGPACELCKEKSGVDPAATGKVACSFCQGKGCETDGSDSAVWPANALAWRLRGLACSDVGNYELAIAAFSQALDLEPSYADAYYDRGWAYLAIGRIDEGEIDLAEAARLARKYVGPSADSTHPPGPMGRLFGWLGRK